MTVTHEPPFPRTTCACAECVEPCSRQPGSLVPGDLERIAVFLQQPLTRVLTRFWASPGALIGNSATGEVLRVGTITPQLRHGRCVFLDDQDLCTIHPVAPVGCAFFDMHMDPAEGQRRAAWVVRQQMDPTYQSLRRTLPLARSWRPGT